jgi:hypothetical protein
MRRNALASDIFILGTDDVLCKTELKVPFLFLLTKSFNLLTNMVKIELLKHQFGFVSLPVDIDCTG